jgi:RNA polymerase sigma-70 factor (ECF subfamily)
MTTAAAIPWQEITARLRPFVARRVSPADIDDVMQDIFVRMQRSLPALRDDERFTPWLFQVARSSVAEHWRTRARHPLPDRPEPADSPAEPDDDDREVERSLARCISVFVSELAPPYRQAVTLVELDGLTIREAADIAHISVSGMKSRVQRGREQLRRMFEKCCEILLDARGKVTELAPRTGACGVCK